MYLRSLPRHIDRGGKIGGNARIGEVKFLDSGRNRQSVSATGERIGCRRGGGRRIVVYSGIEDAKRDAGRNVWACRRIGVSAGGGRRMVSVYSGIEDVKRDAGRNVSAFRRIWVSAGGGRRMVSV